MIAGSLTKQKDESFKDKMESKTHDATSTDSEMKVSDTKDSDGEESRKAQSSPLQDPSILKNVDSVAAGSSVTLEDTSHIIDVANTLACGTVQTERANEPMELSAEDEIKITTANGDKTNDVLKEILYTSFHSVDFAEATTSQDNSPSSSYTNKILNAVCPVDQSKVKRSISKGQVPASSAMSIEKSDDSSDEDSSKRQKLNKSARNASAGNINDDAMTFQRNKSKAKQRNYRKRRNITSDNEDSSENTLSNEVTREASIPDTAEGTHFFRRA